MILNGAALANNTRMRLTIPFAGQRIESVIESIALGSVSSISSPMPAMRYLVTLYNQQKIMEANIERAARGLPPLNTQAYAPTYNVGLSPDTKNLLILGGLALLAVVLLAQKKR